MDRYRSQEFERRSAMPTDGNVSRRVLLQGWGGERRKSALDAVARREVHANTILWCSPHGRLAGKTGLHGQCETSTASDAADGSGSDLSETAVVDTGARTSDLSIPAAGTEDRSSGSGLGQRHYLYSIETGFHLSGCGDGLVQPVRSVLGNIGVDGKHVLSGCTGLGIEESPAGHFQHRSGSAIHQRCIHESIAEPRHCHQHGWARRSDRQYIHRTIVANGEIRRSLSEGLHGRSRIGLEPERLLRLLQHRASTSGLGLSDTQGGLFSAGGKGLWKLTLLWKSAKNADSHKQLEKTRAKSARSFHSSHRPGDGDLLTTFF